MEDKSVNNWYALFVITGEEEKVKERILYRFRDELRVLVPKRRLRERKQGKWIHCIKTLFPGYILINGNLDVDGYYRLKGIPGLIRLLRGGHEPLKIPRYEMEIINKLICNDETIGFSNVFVQNGRVVVVDGPLVSQEGIIVSVDHRKGRAKVQLNFLGEPRLVDLGISVLQPA
ncbi:MAG TPA: antiterminator LoaP [Clostridiaceae bacterium]|jgi:transcriptional antiterminator NusG|nr:antiterminator LoaP [Clostridiaceae bacterium]